MRRYDVVIVGSGFAATILARGLAVAGRSVALVERGHHPRHALGESSTPLAGLSLERLGARLDAADLTALSTWGRWRRALPHLRCGLKRGFTFYRHTPGRPFANGPENASRLLFAASPDDAVADTHWLRADVDHHLLRQAVAAGATYFEGTEVLGAEVGDAGVRLATSRGPLLGEAAVDGSGRGRALARHLGPAEDRPPPLQSAAVAAHFTDLPAFVELARRRGATLEPGPYPDERAAIHHLLEEGWVWVLPFDHGVASCGLVLRERSGAEITACRDDPAEGWRRVLARYPTLAEQLDAERATTPLRLLDGLAYRADRAAHERCLLLPHSFAFVDPMFSTGIAWSLLAVERLLDLLTNRRGDPVAYDRLLQAEADQIERLIAAADLAAGDFRLFIPLTFLYFATVSHDEAAQRLAGRSDPWAGFLGAGEPRLEALFAEARERLAPLARRPTADGAASFRRWIVDRLADRDVVGLDLPRRHLYPVDLDLLVERHDRLGLSREAVLAALPRLRGAEL